MTETIDRAALQARLTRNPQPILVEALPASHFEQAHLPGALNIPHDSVDALAARLLPDKNAVIIVYCASKTCRNSDFVAQRLAALGYSRVRTYPGGKADWIEAGFATERGPGARSAA
jgi:rhodanese-related sulfurtransferase